MTAPKEPVDQQPTDEVLDPQPEQDVLSEAGAEMPADPVATLQTQLDQALAALAEQKEAVLRARADAENVRRRAQEDVAKARKFSIESFAEGLVPVRDSLESALNQPEQTVETLREGVEITLKQLTSAFERSHLVEIAPAKGDKFDPHLHQAISSLPAEQPANTVIDTLQKGYLIADRTLRPALVTVCAG